MEFLESTQERDASVTAEFVKAEVLAKVTFAMSEKDPALRVMKAVADYYSLHRNLRLDFINGKPKKAVYYSLHRNLRYSPSVDTRRPRGHQRLRRSGPRHNSPPGRRHRPCVDSGRHR
jgi:hypothetical protein